MELNSKSEAHLFSFSLPLYCLLGFPAESQSGIYFISDAVTFMCVCVYTNRQLMMKQLTAQAQRGPVGCDKKEDSTRAADG